MPKLIIKADISHDVQDALRERMEDNDTPSVKALLKEIIKYDIEMEVLDDEDDSV